MRLQNLKPLKSENDKSHGPPVCMLLLHGKVISLLWIGGGELEMQQEEFWGRL